MTPDLLYYNIVFKKDDTSFDQIINDANELKKSLDDVFIGEAAEDTEEWHQAFQRLTESTGDIIERLVELQKEMDGYKSSLKEIADAKKSDEGATQAQYKQEQELKAALSATSKEYRSKHAELSALTATNEQAGLTYDQLSAHVRELRRALQQLPLDATTKEKDELIAAIRRGNDELKEFDAVLGDHRRNVGNYADTLGVASGAIAAFQGPLGPIAGRISAANSTMARAIPLIRAKAAAWGMVGVAMAATGIGAVIAVITLLVKALRTAQPILDLFARTADMIGAVIGNVVERFGALFNITEGTTLNMREAAKAASELRDRKIELREATIKATIAEAEMSAQIARLRLEAEDEMNTHQERIASMEQAADTIRAMYDSQIERQKEAVEIMKVELDMTTSTAEERQKLADETARLIGLEQRRDSQLRQLVRRRQTIINSLRVETEQRERNIRKVREEMQAGLEASRKLVEAMRRTASQQALSVDLSRQIVLLRRYGNERAAIELELQIERTRLEADFEQNRDNIRRQFAQLADKRAEQLMLRNVTRQQARQQMLTKIEAEGQSERERIALQMGQRRLQLEARAAEERERIFYEQDVKAFEKALDDRIAALEKSLRAETNERVIMQTTNMINHLKHNRDRVIAEERMAAASQQVAEEHNAIMIGLAEELTNTIAFNEEKKNERLNELIEERMAQNMSQEQAHAQATIDLRDELNAALEQSVRAHQKRIAASEQDAQNLISDINREEANKRADAILEHFEVIRQIREREATLDEGLAQGRDERLIMLEIQRNERIAELTEQYRDAGVDAEEAALLARERAYEEFADRVIQTEKRIADEQVQWAMERNQRMAEIAVSGGQIIFGENKAVAMADTIVASILAAQRARATAPPGLGTLAAAAELAIGAANVARIARTKIGDSQVGGGESGGASLPRGFEVVERQDAISTPVAQQVAESVSSGGEMSPVFEFHGDLDNEVMAIKVRQGNRMIDTKTLTTKSRN